MLQSSPFKKDKGKLRKTNAAKIDEHKKETGSTNVEFNDLEVTLKKPSLTSFETNEISTKEAMTKKRKRAPMFERLIESSQSF